MSVLVDIADGEHGRVAMVLAPRHATPRHATPCNVDVDVDGDGDGEFVFEVFRGAGFDQDRVHITEPAPSIVKTRLLLLRCKLDRIRSLERQIIFCPAALPKDCT